MFLVRFCEVLSVYPLVMEMKMNALMYGIDSAEKAK